MTAKEVMEHLLAGEKMRLGIWPSDKYIFLDSDGEIRCENNEKSYIAIGSDIGLEIVKEPEVYEVECIWRDDLPPGFVYPSCYETHFNWRKLVGKRTKLRIEVIS